MTTSEIQPYSINRHSATVSPPKQPPLPSNRASTGNTSRSKINNQTNRPFRGEESEHRMEGHRRTVSNVTPTSPTRNRSGHSNRAQGTHGVASPRGSVDVQRERSHKKRQNVSPPRMPDDIPLEDIGAHGLPLLLQSRLPLCYFLRFLLEEHSCENLICFLEIEHYQSQRYQSAYEQQNAALQILDVYLSPRSPFEVNVTERAHAQCRSAVSSEDPEKIANGFSAIKPAVYQMLLDAYSRFTRSDWWRSMASQLEGKRAYTIEDRKVTVSHLIGYLKRLHQHDLVHAPERAALFRELVADFCRTVVGVEISHLPLVETGDTFGSNVVIHGNTVPALPQTMPPDYPHTIPHRDSQDSNSDKSSQAMRKMKSNPLMKLRNGLRRFT